MPRRRRDVSWSWGTSLVWREYGSGFDIGESSRSGSLDVDTRIAVVVIVVMSSMECWKEKGRWWKRR